MRGVIRSRVRPPAAGGGTITHGSQLTSSNTGVPAGTTLTTGPSSGGTIASGNYTANQWLNPSPDGFFDIPTGPATFTNCKFSGPSGAGIGVDTASSITFDHCEFDGGLYLSTSSSVTFTDCWLHDPGADFLHITGDSPAGSTCDNITLTRCLFSHITQGIVVAGAHLDGTQTRGINGALFDMCAWRLGPQWDNAGDPAPINASLFFENANGGTNNVEVRKCFFEGGTQVVFLQPFTGYLRFSDNIWSTQLPFGELVRNDSAVTPTVWTNNLEDDLVTAVNF